MTAPRPPLLVLAVLAVVVVGASVLAVVDARRPTPRVNVAAAAVAPPGDRPVPRATSATVLADWDRRRAAAWAAGDTGALTALYVPGSRAGREDVAMLRRWAARGLRVTGLRMQVLDLRSEEVAADHWEVVVTDRLAGGVAVGRRTRAALPRDRWSTRRIELRRVAGAWRVGEVRPARS